MIPAKGGFQPEALKLSDYSHEHTFGSTDVELKPLGRSVDGFPVIYQGAEASCISCSVTWIKTWLERDRPDLSWEWLAQISKTGPDGATPSQVLEPARKIGICTEEVFNSASSDMEKSFNAAQHTIPGYFILRSYTKAALYSALVDAPIMVGLRDFQGVGGHMMVGLDLTEDGERLKCVNWWTEGVQSVVEIPFDDNIIFAAAIKPTKNLSIETFPMLQVLFSKLSNLLKGDLRAKIAILLGAGLILAGLNSPPVEETISKFGASGVGASYRTTLSSSITNSGASIAVSSVTLFTGETVSSTDQGIFPAYFMINPGGATQEIVECWGLSSLTWTGCVRGITALGSNTTSTVSGANFAHAAGETIIMTNVPAFFNRFVDRNTNQSVSGTKSFVGAGGIYIGDGTTSTGGEFIRFNTGQAASPYFRVAGPGVGMTTSTFYFSVDGSSELLLNSSGTVFTAGNGITITGGVITVNASTTQGLTFDSDSKLALSVDLTSGLSFDSSGKLTASSTVFASSTTPSGYYGDGSDGVVEINTNTTLTRDMYYDVLTVSGTAQIFTGGFRVFAKTALIRATGTTAFFKNNGTPGGTGTAGSGATAGTGGTAGTSTAGTLPGGHTGATGINGQGLAAGDPTNELNSTTGTAGAATTTISTQSFGAKGGRSGTISGVGSPPACSSALLAATSTASGVYPNSYGSSFSLFFFSGGVVTAPYTAASGGSGQGGCIAKNGNSTASGGAGGGGGGGGLVHIIAKNIVDYGSGVLFQANGGDGGTAGASAVGGATAAAAGSGGGGGGNGGVIILDYNTTYGSASTSVSGGSGGTGGLGAASGGAATGTKGQVGESGYTGVVFTIN